MPRSLKCYGECGKTYPGEFLQKISGKNYCPVCYESRRVEEAQRQKLNKYIARIFNMNYPDSGLQAQVKKFKEQDGFKYPGIEATLYYIVEVKKMELTRKYGIGLVPNYYEEAKAYFEEYTQRLQTEKVTYKTVTVKLKKPVYVNEYRQKKMINMEELLNDAKH